MWLKNRVLTFALPYKDKDINVATSITLYKAFISNYPDFDKLRVFGCKAVPYKIEVEYCGGVTCACTCPKRRNINVVIQDTCTLSSSVNKCITICTPSIYLVIRLATPLTYLVSDAGTVKDSKSRHNLLICRQECVLLPLLLLFLSIIFILLHRILYYSYSISLYFKLTREHLI